MLFEKCLKVSVSELKLFSKYTYVSVYCMFEFCCQMHVSFVLQTCLECVRLRTFGRYGLQQIQVDTHYLQLYLWRFVYDEKSVTLLANKRITKTHNLSRK